MTDAGVRLWALGAFRSGTTLLHSLLNAHPEIALVYELNLHDGYPQMPFGRPGPDWRLRWDRWNGSLTRAGLPVTHDPQPPTDWNAAADRLFDEFAGRKGARIRGEKSPLYLHCAERLLQDQPNDKFLILWREPADILRSVRRAAQKSRYFNKPLLDAWFYVGMDKLLTACADNPANTHQLSYHQLTAAPVETLNAVWQFLGVPSGQVDPERFKPAFAIEGDAELHAPIAAGRVVAPTARPEVLTPAERQKAARYRQHWAAQYDLSGKFADEPDLLPDAPLTPREQAVDRFAARVFQFYNRQIQTAYLCAPNAWLDAYRARR